MQLLAEGEIWPGVTAEELAMRRRRLAGALPPGGIAIIPAASRTFMTGAIPYAYRQARPWFTILRQVPSPGSSGSIAFIPAASSTFKTGSIPYAYRKGEDCLQRQP